MADPLCLMQIHAHPDDEASKGSGVVARYSAEGVRCVLVTCTGGEAGEILNPGADTPEARADLPAVRRAELVESVRVLGYARLELLGYRDSGMPESEHNRHPAAFVNAHLDEAVGRVVRIVREERPQVIVAYGEDHSGYPHPDHIRAHEVAVAAFDAAGDPLRYPDTGAPWRPLKLYYVGWTLRGVRAIHDWCTGNGIESPFGRWLDRPDRDDRFTTRIDVGASLDRKRASLLAHATQVGTDWGWLRVPDRELRTVWPWEEYILARTHVEPSYDADGFETDLFSGVRAPVAG